MRTETTNVIFSMLLPSQTEIMLPDGSQIQVIGSFSEMANAPPKMIKRFQYAALIKEEQILLIWHDEFDEILNHAAEVEGRLLSLVSTVFRDYDHRNSPILFR